MVVLSTEDRPPTLRFYKDRVRFTKHASAKFRAAGWPSPPNDIVCKWTEETNPEGYPYLMVKHVAKVEV